MWNSYYFYQKENQQEGKYEGSYVEMKEELETKLLFIEFLKYMYLKIKLLL